MIYDALQELQRRREADEAKRQQAAITQHRDAIFADAGDPVGGNPKGDVTLVEFFDYRCGYCRSMASDLRSLMASDKQLRFVFKDLPILSPELTVAARAALAAEKQGKYSDMHFAMMQAKDLSHDAISQSPASRASTPTAWPGTWTPRISPPAWTRTCAWPRPWA